MDMRRELAINNRQLRAFEGVMEHTVGWWVYDAEASGTDPVYDVGERRYKFVGDIPVFWVAQDDPDERTTAEGRVLGRTITFGANTQTLFDSNVPDPSNATEREDDIIFWEGNWYDIRDYEPTGTYVPGVPEMNVRVTAVQRFGFDAPADAFPTNEELPPPDGAVPEEVFLDSGAL